MTPRALLTRAGIIAGLILGSFVVLGGPATAAELPSVPVNERIPERGRTTPGTTHEVSTTPVDPANVGSTCNIAVTGANNESVHPGNDILVASANTVTIPDVERAAGTENIPADGQLELGTTVTISVRLGADGLFSGGSLAVAFDCTPPPPPPTVPTTTPATTPPTTVVKIGTPPPVQTRCDDPETPETDTTADDCALPATGSSITPLAWAGAIALTAGLGLASRRKAAAR
jgi:LPXTG-motif cell wall-anchored protein